MCESYWETEHGWFGKKESWEMLSIQMPLSLQRRCIHFVGYIWADAFKTIEKCAPATKACLSHPQVNFNFLF